jgi:NAD(P)-dependent dehydrogenase (short-subunit alcohol dehydrogenase family)
VESKVALVTGAGQGIGRASALTFARRGAKVGVVDINSDGGEETVSKIFEEGGEGIFVYADVSKAADVKAMVRKVVEAYGRLDYAHNNAGISGPVSIPPHEYPEEAWDQVIDINLKGVWLCMKYEVQQMLKQGGGAIVNTASIAGLFASPNGLAAYSASKHGVVGLTQTFALAYAMNGIRVNAICPGTTNTPMNAKVFSTSLTPDAIATRMGRFAEPEEQAEAALWLCSDAASFVTGQALPVDGGHTAL